jgi:integrase
VKLGQDPAGEKSENRKRASDTFETVAAKFLAAKKTEMRPGSYDQVRRHIETYARPLNGLQVANIVRRDIATLIGTVKENSGAVTSNRVRATLSDFFGWAMSEGIDGVEANPVDNTNKSEEKPRERVLKDHELRMIWKYAGDDHYGSIIKLLMLTGQRADEIASLRWTELTVTTVPEKRITDTVKLPQINVSAIELPSERTKNGRPHIVPLSPPADTILTEQPRRADHDGSLRDFVFGIGQQGFSGWSRCKERLDDRITKEMGEPLDHWTPHDLRRTMSTLMNDRLGVLPHVVEAILNHVSGSKGGVAGVYNKALYLRERVEALNLWADHLISIINGHENNVTPLRRPA